MVLFAIKRFLSECSFFLFDLFYFYGDKTFRKVDLAFFISYLWKNPYRVSKDFLKKRGDNEIYTYGETPLKTAFQLLKLCNIQKEDHVIDLGSGSGRFAFFIHLFSKAKVTAMEENPLFCKKMASIANRFELSDITVINQDYLNAPFTEASIIYLCDLFIEDKRIEKLASQLSLCKEGTKIICVGFPINLEKNIKLIHEIEGDFLWGKSTIYLHEVVPLLH